jgi:hypothetical protein
VLVRLIDSSRQGQLPIPATAARDSRAYRLPGYLAALGPKVGGGHCLSTTRTALTVAYTCLFKYSWVELW